MITLKNFKSANANIVCICHNRHLKHMWYGSPREWGASEYTSHCVATDNHEYIVERGYTWNTQVNNLALKRRCTFIFWDQCDYYSYSFVSYTNV